jgi:site-specific recombinase XerD
MPSKPSPQSRDRADIASQQPRASLFDAAKERLERGQTSTPPQPERPTEVPSEPALNPVLRYLADRDALPATMKGYHQKMRQAQSLLIESGYEHGKADQPPAEFPWHLLTVKDAQRLERLVTSRYSNAKTRENLLGIVRSLVRETSRAGLMSLDERERILGVLPIRACPRSRVGRVISPDEQRRLLTGAATHPDAFIAARDIALISVFLSTGFRVSDVAGLQLSGYQPSDGSLVGRVKGGSNLTGWLNQAAQSHLDAWIKVRGKQPGPLFLANASGDGLTAHGIYQRVRAIWETAGIARITPHDFRRTFITSLLRAGVDPFTVARLVGHARVTTTMLYDRRTEEEGRAAVLNLNQLNPWPSPDERGER